MKSRRNGLVTSGILIAITLIILPSVAAANQTLPTVPIAAPTLPTPAWQQHNYTPAPSDRASAPMAYDSANRDLIIFGGELGSNGFAGNDTWAYSNGSWRNVTRGIAPPPTDGASLAYDSNDGYLVLFGGFEEYIGSTGRIAGWINQTWIFQGGNWKNITRPVAPPASYDGGMTYDSKDRAIVWFGGCRSSTCAPAGSNYTWEFAHGAWRNVTKGPAPPSRSSAGFVYDTAGGYVLLFGGYSARGFSLNDTWTFSKGVWTNITGAVAPSPRYLALVAYDNASHSVVLYGGDVAVGTPFDTWIFSKGAWSAITPSPNPTHTANVAFVYYPPAKECIFLDGTSSTWTFVD